MKYLKCYNSHSEYLNSNIIPNVSYCDQEDEVHYNYHEYVDLGLPSGTLWAKMNVGAENETDYGLYFAWGETKGYTVTPIEDYSSICIIEDNRTFSWPDYKLANGNKYLITKYNLIDNLTKLELVDDGVSINWNSNDWIIPTKELFEELSNTEYVTIDFVREYQGKQLFGYLITSKINENTLFIPASGKIEDSQRTGDFGEVLIWSSTRSSSDFTKAWRIHFKLNSVEIKDRGRGDGCVLRGVLKN